VFHELGTNRGIPPRPFLAPSLFQSEAVIKKAVREVIKDYMTQGMMDFDFYRMAFRAFERIGHELAEAGRELANPEDEKRRR
jgi:hypothetical protein